MSTDPEEVARQRAEVIMRVQAGQLTATAAAELLGVSRKTYHEWEKRGLASMLAGLTDRPPGRPMKPKPDPALTRLEKEKQALLEEMEFRAEAAELREIFADLGLSRRKGPVKKTAKRKRRKKKR
jgi:hypothetical protein